MHAPGIFFNLNCAKAGRSPTQSWLTTYEYGVSLAYHDEYISIVVDDAGTGVCRHLVADSVLFYSRDTNESMMNVPSINRPYLLYLRYDEYQYFWRSENLRVRHTTSNVLKATYSFATINTRTINTMKMYRQQSHASAR